MRISALIMVAAIIFISTINAGAESFELGYGTHDISKSIRMDDDAAYVIHMEPGDRLVVDLVEINGIQVDYYLTNITAYMAYQARLKHQVGPLYLYSLGRYSSNFTTTINYEYTTLIRNTMVVLIDNADHVGVDSTSPVTVTGTISVHKNVWTLENILITALIIGIIVAFMVGVKLPKRKKVG
jgi:hypothetical protein